MDNQGEEEEHPTSQGIEKEKKKSRETHQAQAPKLQNPPLLSINCCAPPLFQHFSSLNLQEWCTR